MKRILLLVLLITSPVAVTGQTKTKGILLEDLTWLEAEKVLAGESCHEHYKSFPKPSVTPPVK